MTRVPILLSLLFFLTACGQTGPLYLPAETVTAPSSAPTESGGDAAPDTAPENEDDDEETPAG